MPDLIKVTRPDATWLVVYDNSDKKHVLAEFLHRDDAQRYRDTASVKWANGGTFAVVHSTETADGFAPLTTGRRNRV